MTRLLRTVLSLAVACALLATGCREAPERDTALFERAEQRLRSGDYEGATRDYEVFLENYPTSPFAPMARQRLTSIDRELEAVMGRRASPAPIYIRPIETREAERQAESGTE